MVLLSISLFAAVAGLSGLEHGLENPGHREGPEFAVFGGAVSLAVSVVGSVISFFVLGAQRAWWCARCNNETKSS